MQRVINEDLYVIGSIYCTKNINCGRYNITDSLNNNIIEGDLYVYEGTIKSIGNISLLIQKPLQIKNIKYDKNKDVFISGDLLVNGNIICTGSDICTFYDIDKIIIRKEKIKLLKEKMRT